MSDRIAAQLAFLDEADRLKSVVRASKLHDGSRRENSAEHSWHVMLFAFVLAEHSIARIDTGRVLQMLLLHDLVEIDAGDNPIHGAVDHAAQEAAELAAADRIFGLLPDDQAKAFRAIWDEFEAAETADARFAKAIDRFQTPLANLANGGGTWDEYNVTFDQLEARVGDKVRLGSPALWEYLRPILARHFGAT